MICIFLPFCLWVYLTQISLFTWFPRCLSTKGDEPEWTNQPESKVGGSSPKQQTTISSAWIGTVGVLEGGISSHARLLDTCPGSRSWKDLRINMDQSTQKSSWFCGIFFCVIVLLSLPKWSFWDFLGLCFSRFLEGKILILDFLRRLL